MYNSEPWISKCLQSLLRQQFNEDQYEILVIDDGSTDKGAEIVESLMRNNPQILLIKQVNKGQAAARNTGIRNAQGRYIGFVDSDDYLEANSLYSILEIAINNDLEILTYNMVLENQSNVAHIGKSIEPIQTGAEYIATHNYNNGPCYYLTKTAHIIDNGIYFQEGRYCEDGMFTMKLFLSTRRMSHIDYDVYHYVLHPGSTVTRKDNKHQMKMIEDFTYAVDYMTALIESKSGELSDACLLRLSTRRNSYIYFLQLRMLRSSMPINTIMESIQKLEGGGIYPYPRLSKDDYPGFKTSLIHFILNHKWLFYIACRFYRIIK